MRETPRVGPHIGVPSALFFLGGMTTLADANDSAMAMPATAMASMKLLVMMMEASSKKLVRSGEIFVASECL